ncbi:DsbA family protein [Nonomuraea longicatena]|uniref:Thioredoxin domain-containing protein n=1 Tax=Nonomuraea longicatena TaxID=83682 RepID=A0ABN1PB11_9ACTN
MSVNRREMVAAMQADDRRKAARRRNLLLSLTVFAVFAVVLGGVLVVRGGGGGDEGGTQVVRADSHRLQTAADGKVTLVEFLDFECGGCKAFYPVVEKLRKKYDGKITFVVRYFPLANHFNSSRAARAVEAASQQGRFEAMYKRMFERQEEWGRKQVPMDDLFRTYAKDLGLDLAAWDRAYEDPATLKRVEKDAEEGQALQVDGTPTFFLNGKKIRPESEEAFEAAIDALL